MPAPFQTSFQTFATDFGIKGILDAAVTNLAILDPTENNEITLLVETDDPYVLQVDWQVTGAAVPSLGGTWLVSAFINDIDGNTAATHGALAGAVDVQVPVSSGTIINPGQTNYSVKFTQAAGSVVAGLYQFVVAINHVRQGATPPLDNKLTENVGFAQSSPVKFTKTTDETN